MPEQLGGYRKRAVDVAIAGIALVLLTPVLLAALLLIRLLIGKPVFVVERFIGLRGKTFACYKFRTTLFHEHGTHPVAAHTWLGWCDHRPWGGVLEEALRSTRLDKVPLLISVLVGDMSLWARDRSRRMRCNGIIPRRQRSSWRALA